MVLWLLLSHGLLHDDLLVDSNKLGEVLLQKVNLVLIQALWVFVEKCGFERVHIALWIQSQGLKIVFEQVGYFNQMLLLLVLHSFVHKILADEVVVVLVPVFFSPLLGALRLLLLVKIQTALEVLWRTTSKASVLKQ